MRQPEIKAIETTFNGVHFRSRLEARWAVFFKCLELPYEYEPEGFQLLDELRYLPDFWLPEQKIWFEVKGPEPSGRDVQKACELAKQSGFPVVIKHELSINYIANRLKDPYSHDYAFRLASPQLGDVNSRWGFAVCLACNKVTFGVPHGDCRCTHSAFNGAYNPKLIDAFCWANAIRFDHPNIKKMVSAPVETWGIGGGHHEVFGDLQELISDGIIAKLQKRTLSTLAIAEEFGNLEGE